MVISPALARDASPNMQAWHCHGLHCHESQRQSTSPSSLLMLRGGRGVEESELFGEGRDAAEPEPTEIPDEILSQFVRNPMAEMDRYFEDSHESRISDYSDLCSDSIRFLKGQGNVCSGTEAE
jgi:hypothetical protein